MENKKHKINTSTFDHIDKDYYDLRNKMLLFNAFQICVEGILIALFILK